jgi:hypothetical protein
MESIDPQTKVFTDLRTAIKRELVGVNSELNVPNSEKKRLRESLALAQRAARPIQFPTNIQLVQRYYDKIETTVASNDGDSGRMRTSCPKSTNEEYEGLDLVARVTRTEGTVSSA